MSSKIIKVGTEWCQNTAKGRSPKWGQGGPEGAPDDSKRVPRETERGTWGHFGVKRGQKAVPERDRFLRRKMVAKKSVKHSKKIGPGCYAHH